MVSAETEKCLVQPVCDCDGVHSMLTLHSLFREPALRKKGKLAYKVNEPNFIISITTLLFTSIQIPHDVS